MTALKIIHTCLPAFASLACVLLTAGCGHQDSSSAPGAAPPAVVTPPPPITYKPGMMEQRRRNMPAPQAGH